MANSAPVPLKRAGLTNRTALAHVISWVALFAIVFLLARLAMDVLASRSMSIDFSFLRYPANFDISGSSLPFSGSDSYAKALLIGFINTVKAAIVCIGLATLLGLFIGVARLSTNPLLRGSSGALVEILRNVPPLLQLFAWSAVLQFSLPPAAKAWEPIAGIAMSNRGIAIPSVAAGDHFGPIAWLGTFLCVVAIAMFVRPFRQKGDARVRDRWAIPAVLLFFAAIAFFASGSMAFEVPERRGFNFRGGVMLAPEFAALVISLSLYTAGYIAEIVRGAILSVPKGQSEAAAALGLHKLSILRLVILPQALRTAIPPMTNQYINATKSTSLAVAVGYSDIVSIGNTIMNQSGRAIEVIAILVFAYLLLNLVISWIMNRLNSKLSLA